MNGEVDHVHAKINKIKLQKSNDILHYIAKIIQFTITLTTIFIYIYFHLYKIDGIQQLWCLLSCN